MPAPGRREALAGLTIVEKSLTGPFAAEIYVARSNSQAARSVTCLSIGETQCELCQVVRLPRYLNPGYIL
jgi:hypothetical protein